MESYPDNPPFMGFFPPVTDGQLLSLINTATPGHPEREALSPGALAEQRIMAFELLEKRKTFKGHEQAERIAREVVSEGRPFGLYLRNFYLGSMVFPGRDSPHGIPQVLTLSTHNDTSLQTIIEEHTKDTVPFISIANRAWDGDPLPHLNFSNENWERAVKILIQHAGAVVMYFLTSTPGVSREVELLRTAKAEDRTLIVVSDEDPREDSLYKIGLALFGSQAAAETGGSGRPGSIRGTQNKQGRTPPPSGFPHVIRIRSRSKNWGEVESALDTLVKKAVPSPRRKLPKLPPANRPSPEALAMARDFALDEYDLGVQLAEKGEGEAAEDAFVRSIAYSHWARDPLGRAVAFLMLGNVERYLLKYANEAVKYYLMGFELIEGLLPESETAKEYYEPAARNLIEYLKELGDWKGVQYMQARLDQHRVGS